MGIDWQMIANKLRKHKWLVLDTYRSLIWIKFLELFKITLAKCANRCQAFQKQGSQEGRGVVPSALGSHLLVKCSVFLQSTWDRLQCCPHTFTHLRVPYSTRPAPADPGGPGPPGLFFISLLPCLTLLLDVLASVAYFQSQQVFCGQQSLHWLSNK